VGGVNSWGSTVLGSSVLGFSGTVCSSAINRETHMASFAALVRVIYSALVEDSTTVCCLLLDHDTADRLDSSGVTFLPSEHIQIPQYFCECPGHRPNLHRYTEQDRDFYE